MLIQFKICFLWLLKQTNYREREFFPQTEDPLSRGYFSACAVQYTLRRLQSEKNPKFGSQKISSLVIKKP